MQKAFKVSILSAGTVGFLPENRSFKGFIKSLCQQRLSAIKYQFPPFVKIFLHVFKKINTLFL